MDDCIHGVDARNPCRECQLVEAAEHDGTMPAHWAENAGWEPLFDALEELEDAATVAKTITRDGVDEVRMRRLCEALHTMPKLIATAILHASELPGFVVPERRPAARSTVTRILEQAEGIDMNNIVVDPNLKHDESFDFYPTTPVDPENT